MGRTLTLTFAIIAASSLWAACTSSDLAGDSQKKASNDDNTVSGSDDEKTRDAKTSPVDGSDDANIKVGVGQQRPAIDNGGDAGARCKSDHPEIAKVDAKTCVVTGVKPGKANVMVTSSDGSSKAVGVTVTPEAQSSAGVSVPVGDKQVATDGKGGKLTNCTVANGAIAKVDKETCLVTGASPGGTTVTGIDSHGDKVKVPVAVSANGELDTKDAQTVAAIPGVPVIRVGVNFEDLGFSTKSDHDYNDAVLCFSGNFKVDGTDVVSTKAQTVEGTTSSISGCHHTIKVTIIAPDGTPGTPVSYDSRRVEPVEMRFELGSKLEVTMTPYDNCNPGVERTMHQPEHARVAPDVCNTTGN